MPLRERTPTERVVTHLRRETKPASIIAELSDGKIQPLDLGEKRGRWERVTRNLSTLDWVNLRCYSELEGKGVLLDTVPNLEAQDEEEPEDEGAPDDPMVQVGRLFKMASEHCETLVKQIRSADETYETSRNTFILNLTERNNQLETLAGQSLQRLQEAVEMIVEIRTGAGSDLNSKESALLGAADALGAKAGLWAPGSLAVPQLPAGRRNGSGKPASESEEA